MSDESLEEFMKESLEGLLEIPQKKFSEKKTYTNSEGVYYIEKLLREPPKKFKK